MLGFQEMDKGVIYLLHPGDEKDLDLEKSESYGPIRVKSGRYLDINSFSLLAF